ncbi:metallophosphoesterase [Terrisporobacter petrolearius]|uniref:metallophosphoesterase n=1 Tax=Terrisporobacter petrolearius TaxID=1460447 RepID=UPI0022DFE47F|nr:metallophosphoesterase [Terrisporobacter petrolearius]
MIYVSSDLHGFYQEYLSFLDYVNFNSNDTLYILGDVLNRGTKGITLLKDIMKRENIILIKGNHEHTLCEEFEEIMSAHSKSEVNQIINDFLNIEPIGQESTLYDFVKLTSEEKYEIINYLNSLPHYEEIIVNDKNYLLVHGGVSDYSDMPMEFYEPFELIMGPHDFDTDCDYGTIIVGHLPTRYIDSAEPDCIYYNKDSIGIDCGLGHNGRLGVLCLDTYEEFYF